MFDLENAPTGLGKSLIAVGLHRIQYDRSRPRSRRMLVMTSTKALQAQYARDFPGLLVEIKGKANYQCKRFPASSGVNCDQGPCNYGASCSLKDAGCDYFDAERRARDAACVVANYSYWIYNNKQEGRDEPGIGKFDTIVCDEAHDAPTKVADAYTLRFSGKNKLEEDLLSSFPWSACDIPHFRQWIVGTMPRAQAALKEAKESQLTTRAHQANNAIRKLKEALVYITNEREVVIDANKKYQTVTVGIVWPYELAAQVLWPHARKVVFMSATVTGKTLEMMGLDGGQYSSFALPHVIPQERRMIYHVPCVRVNYRMSPADMRAWVMKIDTIARPRIDRNGIVHPVSYARSKYVMENSRLVEHMLTHSKKDTDYVIWRFKRSRGKTLVSPSVTTGYDFPYDQCRWQIIGKIAYPDTSDPITKARCDRDKDFAPYTAMQNFVQTCGRAVRAEDDWAENFIIDDNVEWFMPKYSHFAPDWFLGSIKKVAYAPQPYEEG